MEKTNEVVFFGAGNYATIFFPELKKKYNPVTFCDNDEIQHGKYHLGLPVFSF